MSHTASAAARPAERDSDPRTRNLKDPDANVVIDPDDDKEEPEDDGAQQEPSVEPIGKDPDEPEP